MQLSARTIGKLKEFVTGDNSLGPYRSGPVLVRVFNEYGANDVYPMGGGFPSRHVYAESNLNKLNGSPAMRELIEQIFDPLEFASTDKSVDDAMTSINPYLERDGFRLSLTDGRARLSTSTGEVVDFGAPTGVIEPSSMAFVQDNSDKIRRKIRDGDYRGAITNARSLLEDVMVGIEKQLDSGAGKYDGDLPRLVKRVRKLLKMDVELYKADADLFVMLNGMTSVVDGLAGYSNRASDRHAGGIHPPRHHALMVTNVAVSLCNFVAESAALQLSRQVK